MLVHFLDYLYNGIKITLARIVHVS